MTNLIIFYMKQIIVILKELNEKEMKADNVK